MSEGPQSDRPPAPSTVQPEATGVGSVLFARRAGPVPVPDTLPVPGELGPGLPPADDYEVVGVLGRGSMGVVYLARHRRLDRLVAVKVFYASSVQAARFYAEAQMLAAVQHPGIVPIYEVGEAKGVPYLALEYCAGGNLADKIQATPQPHRQAPAWAETLG